MAKKRRDEWMCEIDGKLSRLIELIESVQPTLISNERDYEDALQELSKLYSQDPDVVNRGRVEYLEVLVNHYEHKRI